MICKSEGDDPCEGISESDVLGAQRGRAARVELCIMRKKRNKDSRESETIHHTKNLEIGFVNFELLAGGQECAEGS